MFYKNSFIKKSLLLAAISTTLFGCGASAANGQFGGRANNAYSASKQALSSNEARTLTLMREEEKIARDVYTTLHQRWNIQTFSRIANSEQRHMDRLGDKINAYGLVDPIQSNVTGSFNNPKFTQLYNDLTNKGQRSALDALHVAAYIEELDIRDLQNAIAESSHSDLDMTYNNLMRGSRNHLRAFVRQISNQGVTYKAQLLSQSEVDRIVNSEQERGGRRGGGHRGGGGRGYGGGRGFR